MMGVICGQGGTLMRSLKTFFFSFAILLLLPAAANAQLAQEFKLPKSRCCLQSFAQSLADQLLDWNQLGRYYEDNQKLKADNAPSGRVVFMGDSITDMWKIEQYFSGKPYINRGIGGQTTPQMLARMYSDVINLHPAAMVVLAGTNDIARNTGPMTADMIQDNLKAMAELAQKHNIAVILCSVLPVSDYTGMKQSVQRPSADILQLNNWLKKYAAEIHAEYVDYYAAVVDANGFLKEGLSMDGLHPNDKGYALMAPLVAAAIDKTLK
jgi:lysophospholipase L1-like esterase